MFRSWGTGWKLSFGNWHEWHLLSREWKPWRRHRHWEDAEQSRLSSFPLSLAPIQSLGSISWFKPNQHLSGHRAWEMWSAGFAPAVQSCAEGGGEQISGHQENWGTLPSKGDRNSSPHPTRSSAVLPGYSLSGGRAQFPPPEAGSLMTASINCIWRKWRWVTAETSKKRPQTFHFTLLYACSLDLLAAKLQKAPWRDHMWASQ